VTKVTGVERSFGNRVEQALSDSIYLRMPTGASSDPVVATPILDAGIRPKGDRKRVGSMIFGLLAGLLFGGLSIHSSNLARDAGNPAADFVLMFFLLSFVLIVVLHEFGHLLAGWSVGFRFSFISIGPLSLSMEYGRPKIRLRRGMPAAGRAGMQVTQVLRLRRRLLIFTTAGPLANLLSAAGAFVLVNYFLSPSKSWLYLPALIFMPLSLVLGIVNLIPFRLGMLYTDGERIAMLLSSRPRARRWICITALANQSQTGVRPKDLRRTWLRAASCVPDGSVDDFASNWLAYSCANDRKDAPLAASHLERCLAIMNRLGPATQDIVTLEAAVFTAWLRNDAVTAQMWLGQVKNLNAIPKLLRIRAEVALPCARKEYEQALTCWQQGLGFIEALPASALQVRLKDGWLEWQGDIRERQQEVACTPAIEISTVPATSTST
jgi:Zn-dependent protease